MRCSFLAFVAYWAGMAAQFFFWVGLVVGLIGVAIVVLLCEATALVACWVGGIIAAIGAALLFLAFICAVIWLVCVMGYRRSCP